MPLAKARVLAAEVPTVVQRCRQGRQTNEVRVITAIFFGKQRMNRMMEVIRPLRIEAVSTVFRVMQEPRIVEIGLRDEMEGPSQAKRKLRDVAFELREKVAGTEIENSVHGIKAERVEVVIFEPIECVLDKVPPHMVAVLTIKVNRLPPRGTVTIGKVRSECTKVVAFRPEMVVDHVQRNGETLSVSGIHQTMKRGRTSVGILRGIGVYAIVSPIAIAGKLSNGHQFDGGDTKIDEVREARNQRVEGPFRREGADVKLIKDAALEGDAFPFTICPLERVWGHNLRWAVNTAGLAA